MILEVILCFANLKLNDINIECYSANSNYVKTSGYKILHLNTEQSPMFQISLRDKYTHFHKRLQASSIYMSGFRKHRPIIDMTNNSVVSGRFYCPC